MSTTIENEIYSYDDDIITVENKEEDSSMYNINTLSADEDDAVRLATIKTFSDYFHEKITSYNGLTEDDDFDHAHNSGFYFDDELRFILKCTDSNRIITYKHLLDLYHDMNVIYEITGVDEHGNLFGYMKPVRTTFFKKTPGVNYSELNRAVKLDASLGSEQFEDYIIFSESTAYIDDQVFYSCLVDIFDESESI
jgi:hypothetical protein